MRIRIPGVEIYRPQGRIESFLPVRGGIFRPAIGDEACVDPRPPDLRLWKQGIELRGLSEESPCEKVGWLRYLVKIECTLPYKFPGGHVAGVRGNLKSMPQQQLGLNCRCDPLGDGVLHRKYLGHLKIVMFGPDRGALHCVGEVHRYPNPIAGTPDGSIHQKIDAKFVRDRLRIPRTAIAGLDLASPCPSLPGPSVRLSTGPENLYPTRGTVTIKSPPSDAGPSSLRRAAI